MQRRHFLQKTTLASLGLWIGPKMKPYFIEAINSRIRGVQVGVITYSFRSMPGDVDQLIKYCTDAGISAIELMGDPAEAFAGSPVGLMPPMNFPTPPKPTNGKTTAPAMPIFTEEMRKKFEERGAKARAWRETATTEKFFELKKKFKNAGISIYAYKPDQALGPKSTDAEIDFAMRAAKALGANSVTVELPNDPAHSKRLGEFASKHQIFVGYHAHTQATDTAWDTALVQSPFNSINLDCGHYIAAGGNNTPETLLAFINKYHSRITSMHIKDRLNKDNGGTNQPWGKGNTPLKEILTTLRDKKYDIPATIELEYDIPEGSDAVKETKICFEYAKKLLNS